MILSIAKGSRGPNGAGKSTIIKCVMGLLNFSGEIFTDGVDSRKDSEEARRRIGYIPQQLAYYDNLTVYDQTLFICKLKKANLARIEENLKKVNLWGITGNWCPALDWGRRSNHLMPRCPSGN
jgi:ABC-2 type transport system ATP-binding protein